MERNLLHQEKYWLDTYYTRKIKVKMTTEIKLFTKLTSLIRCDEIRDKVFIFYLYLYGCYYFNYFFFFGRSISTISNI